MQSLITERSQALLEVIGGIRSSYERENNHYKNLLLAQ